MSGAAFRTASVCFCRKSASFFCSSEFWSARRATANNAAFAALEAQYSNVQVLDWAEASRDHPELFWDDGVHLTDAGAAAYADVLVRNLLGYGVHLVASDLGANSSSSLN